MERGDRIDGWVVEGRLGAGGMGSVYRCRSAATERIVAAIKVLEANLSQSASARERFVREAAIVAGLDHPNIVRVRNVRTEARPPYIEMDFVEGRSLDALARAGPLSYGVARRYLLQVADALAYLHARGVRHRDLKPANLLVDSLDRIKIVDFGLATDESMERITEEGINFGTVSYAPPEWMDPDRLDPVAWDLYAVGVIFYELVTGTVAFPMSGEGPLKKQLLQVMMRKQSAPALDPGQGFPDELRELIRELTEPECADRIQDAATLFQRARDLPEDATVPRAERRRSFPPPPSLQAEGVPPRPPDPRSHVATVPPARVRASAVLMSVALSLTGALVLGAVALLSAAEPGPPAAKAPVPLPLTLPTSRRVEVTFLDAPHGVPIRARLGDLREGAEDGKLVFGAAPTTASEVTWVAGGEGCEACPGEGCAPWCGSGSVPLQGGSGDVVLQPLTGAGRGRVVVSVPAVENRKKKKWTVSGRLGSHAMVATDQGEVTITDVLPGRHRLVVDIGSCPPEAAGCWPDGECPNHCKSVAKTVAVPWAGGTVSERLDIDPD